MTVAPILVITVRLARTRYDGMDEWPPSSARLFQALVAGAAQGELAAQDREALEWLESLSSPTVAAPEIVRSAQKLKAFVPNNELDGVGGDLNRIGEIRVAKVYWPKWLTTEMPLLYGWAVGNTESDNIHGRRVCEIAERLYQLGRGVDMAWATAELTTSEVWAERLFRYGGNVYRRDGGVEGGLPAACPAPGSLASLIDRHQKMAQRFVPASGKQSGPGFVQPPKPFFRRVLYNGRPQIALFDIKSAADLSSWIVWSPRKAGQLIRSARDGALFKLTTAVPMLGSLAEQVLVGRRPGSTEGAPPEKRVHIIPLPSVGHTYADLGIRRVLVKVPPGAGIDPGDILWAFSGLHLCDPDTGEVFGATLCKAEDHKMFLHYGVWGKRGTRRWQTVTPMALPLSAARRSQSPSVPQKGASERLEEEAQAKSAVVHALRQAGMEVRPLWIAVQKEPHDRQGNRAEDFANPRFQAARLWHVEVVFERPIWGPLVVGDGRFFGLGLMKPAQVGQEWDEPQDDREETEPAAEVKPEEEESEEDGDEGEE